MPRRPHAEILEFGVLVEPVARAFAPYARGFNATEGSDRRRNDALVHTDDAGF